MPFIPLPPPAPTGVTPITETIQLTGNYTVTAGTTIYGSDLAPPFNAVADYLTLTNNGSIWVSSEGPQQWLMTGYRTSLINNGSIYLHSASSVLMLPRPGAFQMGSDYWTVYNTGSILLSAGAVAGMAFDIEARVYNSGLFAVQATNGAANAIVSANNGHLFNAVGGQILVEAPTRAVAFGSYNWGDTSPDLPLVVNQGLIDVRTTAPGGTSIAIYTAHMALNYPNNDGRSTIINSGTIRADWAIIGDVSTTTQQAQGPIERVVNLTTGVIEGDIFLDTGDDIIENAGTITGFIGMGEGNDHVSGAGRYNGYIDMGWDEDQFDGGTFADKVYGGRGNDVLNGNGGDDLLLAGFGNDTLSGGAGNDGLFGEWGDDTITTSGGDYVEAGKGNDRIVLGDYTFAAIKGEAGTDTLVFGSGARNFDLGQMGVGTRISGIEAFELQAGQNLTLRFAELQTLLGSATTFRVAASAGNTIALDDGWSRGADVTVGGTLYESWSRQGITVQVTETANVTAGAAPSYGGFDAVAAGPAAPVPGPASGLPYSPAESYFIGYELSRDMVVAADEVFWTDDRYPVFFAQNTNRFENNGQLLSFNSTSDRAFALQVTNFIDVVNNGLVYVETMGQNALALFDRSWGISLSSGSLTNTGTVTVYSEYGNATGVAGSGSFNNSGLIEAYAARGMAIGASGFVGTDGTGGTRRFFNTGEIFAQGFAPNMFGASGGIPAAAIGLYLNGGDLVNDGRIIATVFDGGPSTAETYGVWAWQFQYWDGNKITNNGTISAGIAIRFFNDSTNIPSTKVFTVINNGTITGDIVFNAGADQYNNTAGTTSGTVFGKDGDDTLLGGAGADWLAGGGGNDLIDGRGGTDRAVYSDADAGVTVDLRISGAQNTIGAGTDTLVSIEELTGSAFNDTLTGTDGINRIEGGAGNDTIYGLGGADLLIGGAGDDTFQGGTGDDTIRGDAGNFDTVRYAGNQADYIVERVVIGNEQWVRVTGTGSAAGDGVDLLREVEYLQFADGSRFIGLNNHPTLGTVPIYDMSSDDNVLWTYQVPLGAFVDIDPGDTLTYSATLANGAPLPAWLSFDPATRTFSGTPGEAMIDSSITIRIRVTDNNASDPSSFVTDDFVLRVYEGYGADIIGTNANDRLYGTFRAERLIGGPGDDTFYHSRNYDLFDGGDGSDTVDYSSATGAVSANLASGMAMVQTFGPDGFSSIENIIGSAFNDEIYGSSADNALYGMEGNDHLDGDWGDDTLFGGPGNDYLDGRTGDDRLDGGAGRDDLYGREGNDTFVYNAATDLAAGEVVVGEDGFDTIRFNLTDAEADYSLLSVSGVERIETDPYGHALQIIPGQLQTFAEVSGLFRLQGSGAVVLSGQNLFYSTFRLADAITSFDASGAAADGLSVYAGANTASIKTGSGADYIYSGPGNNTIDGGAGSDVVFFSGNRADYAFQNVTVGGIAYLRVTASGAAAADGVDLLRNVEILSFADQTIPVPTNAPPVLAAALADQAASDSVGWAWQVPAGAFSDPDGDPLAYSATLADGSALPSWLSFDAASRTFSGIPPASAIGSTLALRVIARDNPSDPASRAFDDFNLTISETVGFAVNGTGGDDVLAGTFHADVQQGLGGNDMLYGSAKADVLDGGSGTDWADYGASAAAVSINLATGALSGGDAAGDTLISIENLRGSAGNDSLTGNSSANDLRGGEGNDAISGGGGADLLYGEGGNDTFTVAGGGSAVIDGGSGTDTLEIAANTVMTGTLAGFEAAHLAANLTLTGTQFIQGFATNSSFTGTGAVTVNLSAAQYFFATQMTFSSGVALTVNALTGTNVVKVALGSAVTINGGDGIDQLRGSNLADVIRGGAGNDKIMGLGGADVLTGGAGSDQFRWLFTTDSGLGAAADHVTDFLAGTDKIDLRLLDANPATPGRQSATYIGSSAFHGAGVAEIHHVVSGADMLVEVDLDGNGTADMQLVLEGAGGQVLSASDFLLTL